MAKEKTREVKIEQMKETEGWKIVEEMLQFKVDEIEGAILSNISKDWNDKSYTLFDVWRGQRGVYKQILSFVEKPIKREEKKDEDIDAYE